MKTPSFKLSAIATVAILAACGGGGGTADPAAPTAVVPTPVPSVAPTTEPALDAAVAFMAKSDALRATAIPATGAANFALLDGCYLGNGFSKSFVVADFDKDPFAITSRQFDVGSTRGNIKVLAERNLNNPDGTSRREIDIKYEITYKDGTKNQALVATVPTETIISGSSSGTKLADGSACATSESKSDWRFYGNQKVIDANVRAHNERRDRSTLSNGLPLATPVVYSKYIRLNVVDPANVAKYVTISGPGIVTGSPTAPMTLKMVSARLLRDAPEFAAKNGNFVDWLDTDGFRICRTANGNLAAAELADCLTNGATTNNWGFENQASAAALDTSFDALGVVAGGVYTVKVYNDDGWKTVNGQLNRTPIATYDATLPGLPFSAAALAGTSTANDLFPKITTSSMTSEAIATAVRARAAFTLDLALAPAGAMPDGRSLGWGSLFSFKQGRVDPTQAAFNPASRTFDPSYPAANATSATLAVPAASAKLGLPTYMERTISVNNRNGNIIQSTYQLQ